MNGDAEIVVGRKIFLDHAGEVMDIDHSLRDTGIDQSLHHAPEHRLPADFDERLGAIVGQRPQPGA